MRILIPLLMVSVAFAGCTQGDGIDAKDFEASCPSWVQSPGRPGATVASTFYTNETGQPFEANLEGILIHKPTLLEQPWDWDGAALDVYSWQITAGAINGTYKFRVYAASKDIAPVPGSAEEGKVRWDQDDRLNRLAFRDLSKSGGQYITELIIEEGSENVLIEKEYRIELASSDETPRPSSIWIEYEFIDEDGDSDSPSSGYVETKITLWYRAAHCL